MRNQIDRFSKEIFVGGCHPNVSKSTELPNS